VLVHPVAIAALVLLVVNDHLLKGLYPGWVTGKLSDFAGMVVAPLVLVALAQALGPRRWLESVESVRLTAWGALASVALPFALSKTWAPATRAYEVLFALPRRPLAWLLAAVAEVPTYTSSVVLVRDPTDLVALPAGLLAVWVALRRPTPGAGAAAARAGE
jgi:hypothetical protein